MSKRHVFTVLSTRSGVGGSSGPIRVSRFGNRVRCHGMAFGCGRSDTSGVLSGVRLAVPGNGVVTMIKPSNTNGAALISLLPHCCSAASKNVCVSKIGVGSCCPGSLVDLVKIIARRTVLFGSAVGGGVAFNVRGIPVRSIVHTTGVTGTRSFVRRARRNCRAGVKSHKNGLSKKRHRHVTVTHTMLGGPPVLVLSRTASTLSARDRELIRSRLAGLVGGHASVIVTRHLSAVRRTSRVVIVHTNGVRRHNARGRLSASNKLCSRLYRVRTFWSMGAWGPVV